MTRTAAELVAEAEVRVDGRDDEGVASAVSLLEQALALDPSHGEAYLALASIYRSNGWLRRELALWLGRADLEPSDLDAPERIGWILWFTGRTVDALPWLERAAAGRPSGRWGQFYVGNAYFSLGQYERARQLYGRTLQMHSDHSSAHAAFLWTLFASGDDQHSGPRISAIRGSRLDGDRYDLKRADIEHFLGESAVAVAHARRAVSEDPTTRYWPRGICASTLLGSLLWEDDRSAAEEALDQSVAINMARLRRGDEGHMPRTDLAAVHAIRGQAREACQWLEAAVAAGWWYPDIARRDPLFRNIHGYGRFRQLMKGAAL